VPHPEILFNPDNFLRGPSPNIATLEIKASVYKFGRIQTFMFGRQSMLGR
jgi:hypothetical protein